MGLGAALGRAVSAPRDGVTWDRGKRVSAAGVLRRAAHEAHRTIPAPGPKAAAWFPSAR